MVYGCDGHWWRHRRGLPEFTGLKVRWGGDWGGEFPGVHTIDIEKTTDRLLLGKTGVLGSGGNSGFQALNLVVQFGSRRIILVGFDMTDRSGLHWYGRNVWPMSSNPMQSNFRRWLAAFATAGAQLGKLGAEVVNASPASAMVTFSRRSIADALMDWSVA